MKKFPILITGGAGFIGSNFVRYLLQKNEYPLIINLDALTYAGKLENLVGIAHKEKHIFIQGNIVDRSLIDKLLKEYDIRTIVHFAAESHVDRSITSPAPFIETNIIGTFNLLEAAKQYWLDKKQLSQQECHFHHISTDEVFGTLKSNDAAFTEKTPIAPSSPYSASKASSDHLVRAYYHTYGLPTTTTNCSNNYGPYQHLEKFIPTIITACLQQKKIPIYGDGSNIRDWLYVTDHCIGIETVLDKGRLGETYNIGGNNEWSNLNIAKKICSALNELYAAKRPYETLITFVSDRPGHDWRYAIDTTKVFEELNWQPLETFDTGIHKTIRFFLDQLNNG